jgi:hypothetical protein
MSMNLNAISYRDELISAISDTYKDIHGVRPRHYNFAEMSDEEVEALSNSLYDYLDAEFNREAKEKEEFISASLEAGCPDRETAEKWYSVMEEGN